MVKRVYFMLFFIFLFSASALAVEFSADTVMTHKAGKTTGKIYFKTDRFRMDMKGSEDMTTITRLDRKVIWSVMPKQKMYMEIPFDTKNMPKVQEKIEGEIERKQVGSETIDGHPTKKYLITYKWGNTKDQLYQWFATDINFPVRTAAVDGSWVQEYRNIKMGPQPGSLFELPSGYKKLQMPGEINPDMR